MKYSENAKRFFSNGLLLTAVGLAMRTVALFFNAFITRAVGAEGVGLYTVVMTVYNFAVTFATSGISLTMTRLVASAIGEGREKDVSKILCGGIAYAALFSLSASLVLFFGASFLAEEVLGDIRAAISLKILSPSLLPLALVSVFSGYFVGVRRVSQNAITQILGQLFKIALTVFIIMQIGGGDVGRSAMALSLGTTLTEILSFLVIFIEFLIDRRKNISERGFAFRDVFGTAIPLALSAYIRSALLTLEHILIPKRLRNYGESQSESLASYGVLHGMALPMVLYPMATLSSFSGLLVPEFAEREARGDYDAMRRIASRAFSTTLVYSVVTSAFLLLFSEELGYIIYDSYSAGLYIAVLAPVVPIMYLDHVTDSVLKGIGEQVYSMWVNITDSILSIFLVCILIPKMGIMGYAVCIVLMEAYNFVLSILRLIKKIHFRVSLTRTILLPGISAVIASLLSRSLFPSPGAESNMLLLIIKLSFALLMFVGLYRLLLFLFDMIFSQKQINVN